MTGFKLGIGDVTTVVVTHALPYGVLVETSTGLPGMVTRARAEVGERLRVEVTAVDHVQRRFAAVPAD